MNRLQRIGNNEADLRDLNEQRHDSSPAQAEKLVEFICECGYNDCRAPMQLTQHEYEKVRGAGARFAVLNAQHVISDAESIVEEFERYVVVEKHSDGRLVAEGRDPRHYVKTCRVLVVDDVVEVRLLIKIFLQQEPNCTVVAEAGTGREAIDAAKETQPDVVVLDVDMPEMTGIEALPKIVQLAPAAKVIVFTASATEVDERELVRLGAFNLVPKGGAPNVIVEAIKEASLSGEPRAKRLSTESP